MSGSMFAPAQVMPAGQPIGGAAPPSALATALMGRPQNFALATPQTGLNVPLMSMLMAQHAQQGQNPGFGGAPSPLQQGMNGVGNLLSGNQWNGMPGQSQMNLLSNQAAGNVAGMIPGGGVMGNGVM